MRYRFGYLEEPLDEQEEKEFSAKCCVEHEAIATLIPENLFFKVEQECSRDIQYMAWLLDVTEKEIVYMGRYLYKEEYERNGYPDTQALLDKSLKSRVSPRNYTCTTV